MQNNDLINAYLIFMLLVKRATAKMVTDGLNGDRMDVHEGAVAEGLQNLVDEGYLTQEDAWFYLVQPETSQRTLRETKYQAEDFYEKICNLTLTYLIKVVKHHNISWLEILRLTFIEVANHYLYRDKMKIKELIAQMRGVFLKNTLFEQTVNYYEGLLSESTEVGITRFEALLQHPGLDNWIKMRALNSCALRYRKTGKPEEALAYFEQSLTIAEVRNDVGHAGAVLYNMAILTYFTQRFDKKKSYLQVAEAYLKQASIYFKQEQDDEWLIATWNVQGLIYRDRGNFKEALTSFEQVMKHSKVTTEDINLTYLNKAEIYLYQNNLPAAFVSFNKAISVMLDTDHYKVDAYLGLGLTHQLNGNLPAAQANFEQALNLAAINERNEILPQVYYHLADILRLRGDKALALKRFEQAAKQIEENRPQADEQLKIGLFGRWQQIYERLVLHCLDMGLKAKAFKWAERARARALAEAIQKDDTVKTTPATLADIQAKLSDDTVIFAYFTTGVWDREIPLLQKVAEAKGVASKLLVPSTILLFIITSQTLHVEVCDFDPNDLVLSRDHIKAELKVKKFLKPDTLTYLASVLLPQTNYPGMKGLYIIPHGTLHRISFSALINNKDWPDTRPDLVYALSATIFAQDQRKQPVDQPQGTCLAVGYNGDELDKNGELKTLLLNGETGAQFFANITGGRAIIKGNTGEDDSLQKIAAQYRWLHFICHGHFKPDRPLDSYLEIGQNRPLKAIDILETWYIQADLVILGACQTGVSRVLHGDEPMGLVRAFLAAGAKTILVTLWDVPEFSTLLFMQHFYRCLGQGLPVAVALSESQDWLRNLSLVEVEGMMVDWQAHGLSTVEFTTFKDKGMTHPFADPVYWAGFVLIGNVF